jgi:hypothetical protein
MPLRNAPTVAKAKPTSGWAARSSRRGSQPEYLKEDQAQGSSRPSSWCGPSFDRLGRVAPVERDGFSAGLNPRSRSNSRPEPVGGVNRSDGSATTMANIAIVAGGAGLNGTWARDLERGFTPAGRSKAAKGRPRVEPHERCRASAKVFEWQFGQAAKMPGGGSVTAHDESY